MVKKDLIAGLFYIFFTLIQIAESILPWLHYCKVEFSFTTLFIVEDGLSYRDNRIHDYSEARRSLCEDFQRIIIKACPDFCTNIENIQNAGLLMFSCNIVCIIMSLFLAYLYMSRYFKRFDGSIPSAAVYSFAIIKIFLGVIYLEIIDPSSIKSTWRVDYDIEISFGFYVYFFGVLSHLLASYLLYNFEYTKSKSPSEDKMNAS